MKPVEIKGEIDEKNVFEQYWSLRDEAENLKKAVTLTGLTRVISFNNKGVIGSKFIVVRKFDKDSKDIDGEIIGYPRCIYTVVDDKTIENGEDIDSKIGEGIMNIAKEMGYELLGVSYINMLISANEDGRSCLFLEIYTPIK